MNEKNTLKTHSLDLDDQERQLRRAEFAADCWPTQWQQRQFSRRRAELAKQRDQYRSACKELNECFQLYYELYRGKNVSTNVRHVNSTRYIIDKNQPGTSFQG
ncbi:unnamed protein product [Gongylonema pulchrum]|uniref:Uncharacterized protein n=1 Tax=Gongylonema pulchrum TaxID=637853 RepID=A0A183DKB4_9BILA|nr:unnamed protein product [Gongylonema pulchrum]